MKKPTLQELLEADNYFMKSIINQNVINFFDVLACRLELLIEYHQDDKDKYSSKWNDKNNYLVKAHKHFSDNLKEIERVYADNIT